MERNEEKKEIKILMIKYIHKYKIHLKILKYIYRNYIDWNSISFTTLIFKYHNLPVIYLSMIHLPM